jgi:predicted ATPase
VDLTHADDEAGMRRAVLESVTGRKYTSEDGFTDIGEFVVSRPAILLLDNCDRVIQCCVRLPYSFDRTFSGILLTSRIEARNSAVRIHRLAALEMPDRRRDHVAKTVRQLESVRLFVERAAAARRGFKISDENATKVADICRRLDGIPLAIELAAARLRSISLEQLSQRLGLGLLSAGASTHSLWQGGLRSAIEWSYETLSDVERILLNRLCIAEDWSLEAAEALCSGGGVDKSAVLDLLTKLSDKSVLVVDQRDNIVRYRLLQILREYGAGKLKDAGEYDGLAARHARFYLDLKRVSLPWLYFESRNLVIALAWAAEHEPRTALMAAQRLWRFWFVRKEMIATALDKVGQQAFAGKRISRACTLWAAAKAIRAALDNEFSELESALAPDIATARSELDKAAFDEAWNRGTRLQLEELIEYALSDSD